jgi:hypothetical protein
MSLDPIETWAVLEGCDFFEPDDIYRQAPISVAIHRHAPAKFSIDITSPNWYTDLLHGVKEQMVIEGMLDETDNLSLTLENGDPLTKVRASDLFYVSTVYPVVNDKRISSKQSVSKDVQVPARFSNEKDQKIAEWAEDMIRKSANAIVMSLEGSGHFMEVDRAFANDSEMRTSLIEMVKTSIPKITDAYAPKAIRDMIASKQMTYERMATDIVSCIVDNVAMSIERRQQEIIDYMMVTQGAHSSSLFTKANVGNAEFLRASYPTDRDLYSDIVEEAIGDAQEVGRIILILKKRPHRRTKKKKKHKKHHKDDKAKIVLHGRRSRVHHDKYKILYKGDDPNAFMEAFRRRDEIRKRPTAPALSYDEAMKKPPMSYYKKKSYDPRDDNMSYRGGKKRIPGSWGRGHYGSATTYKSVAYEIEPVAEDVPIRKSPVLLDLADPVKRKAPPVADFADPVKKKAPPLADFADSVEKKALPLASPVVERKASPLMDSSDTKKRAPMLSIQKNVPAKSGLPSLDGLTLSAEKTPSLDANAYPIMDVVTHYFYTKFVPKEGDVIGQAYIGCRHHMHCRCARGVCKCEKKTCMCKTCMRRRRQRVMIIPLRSEYDVVDASNAKTLSDPGAIAEELSPYIASTYAMSNGVYNFTTQDGCKHQVRKGLHFVDDVQGRDVVISKTTVNGVPLMLFKEI